MIGRTARHILCAVLLSLCGGTAHADSWTTPTPRVSFSPDRQLRLTIIPRDITSPLAYFEDKSRGKAPAGQAPGTVQQSARGRLERLDANRKWVLVWDRPLANEVAPVHALVANDGHVATIDDWHGKGYGPNVVVVYDTTGQKRRALSLADMLPGEYIYALPHSVSSIWWDGEARLSPDGLFLNVPIVVPSENDDIGGKSGFVEMTIRLTDGMAIPSAGPAWARATMLAHRVATVKRAGEAAQRRFFTQPLYGPNPPTEVGWHTYLREAFYRLDPGVKLEPDTDDIGSFTGTTVLRAPWASDYAPSEQWVREALTEKREPYEAASLATLGPPARLLDLIDRIVRALPPGGGKGTRIYIAVPPAYRARALTVLARTGAKIIVLDPTRPIPQRPDRLRKFLRDG